MACDSRCLEYKYNMTNINTDINLINGKIEDYKRMEKALFDSAVDLNQSLYDMSRALDLAKKCTSINGRRIDENKDGNPDLDDALEEINQRRKDTWEAFDQIKIDTQTLKDTVDVLLAEVAQQQAYYDGCMADCETEKRYFG